MYHLSGMKINNPGWRADQVNGVSNKSSKPQPLRPNHVEQKTYSHQSHDLKNMPQRREARVTNASTLVREGVQEESQTCNSSQSDHFLELKAQMATMANQMQWIMTVMRIGPTTTPQPRMMGWQPVSM